MLESHRRRQNDALNVQDSTVTVQVALTTIYLLDVKKCVFHTDETGLWQCDIGFYRVSRFDNSGGHELLPGHRSNMDGQHALRAHEAYFNYIAYY